MLTREEYVAICSQCKYRQFNRELGVICGLSGEIAAFEGSCSLYAKATNQWNASTNIRRPVSNEIKKAARKKMFWGIVQILLGLVGLIDKGSTLFVGLLLHGRYTCMQGYEMIYGKGSNL